MQQHCFLEIQEQYHSNYRRAILLVILYKYAVHRPTTSEVHNEELHNPYSTPNNCRVIKSSRMRWTEHVARIGDRRNSCMVLVVKPEGKRPFRRPDLNGKIILNCIFNK